MERKGLLGKHGSRAEKRKNLSKCPSDNKRFEGGGKGSEKGGETNPTT